jgi:thimet oligopeptidase
MRRLSLDYNTYPLLFLELIFVYMYFFTGYCSAYYSYLWSKVYAEDMWSRFKKDGLTNEQVGRDYRKFVLESGKIVDAFEILEKFLGRKPNSEAFYKMLGVEERSLQA